MYVHFFVFYALWVYIYYVEEWIDKTLKLYLRIFHQIVQNGIFYMSILVLAFDRLEFNVSWTSIVVWNMH